MSDDLGDRMKMYEGMEAGRRLMPLLPVLARIDGILDDWDLSSGRNNNFMVGGGAKEPRPLQP